MGVMQHKPLEDIILQKYSLARSKEDALPSVMVGWKYSQEALQNVAESKGECLKWPYKLYADEGYIFLLIEDKSKTSSVIQNAEKFPPDSTQMEAVLKQLKISINIIEILYSFNCEDIIQYYENTYHFQANSKSFEVHAIIHAGYHLGPIEKLQLLTKCHRLEKYIQRGGFIQVQKMFYQYERIDHVSIQYQVQPQNKKDNQFMVGLSQLLHPNTIDHPQNTISHIYAKLNRIQLLKKTVFHQFQHFQNKSNYFQIQNKAFQQFPLIMHETYECKLKELRKEEPQLTEIKSSKKGQMKANLNDSSPFLCEITEINIKQSKGGKVVKENLINDSLFDEEVQRQEGEFMLVNLPEDVKRSRQIFSDEGIMVSTYSSLRDFSFLQEQGVKLIINLSGDHCYNYYINDIDYQWYYLHSLQSHEIVKQPELHRYNIECLVFELFELISRYQAKSQINEVTPKVLIHSTLVLSQEPAFIVLAYLIIKYQFSLQQSIHIYQLNLQQLHKKNQFSLNPIYAKQLNLLSQRLGVQNVIIPIAQKNIDKNSLFWIINYQSKHPNLIVSKYMGVIANNNQVQCLENYLQHVFLSIPNAIIPFANEVYQKFGKQDHKGKSKQKIKILVGKDCCQKDLFIEFAKKQAITIILYEFLTRRSHHFSDWKEEDKQALKGYFQKQFSQCIEIEQISNSFRKPQPFESVETANTAKELPCKQTTFDRCPFNEKEKVLFKYPILRPVWEPIRDDGYYFMIQRTDGGANVHLIQGQNWIGYKEDKDQFFDRIVKIYLQDVPEDKIWIIDSQEEESFFGQPDLAI